MIFLLICSVLLVSASYAWFSISRVPEVVAINTNLGANGNLEIALLSEGTYLDPSLIKTTVGSSTVVQSPLVSNLTWGNVVELDNASYGLGQITLLPSRLDVIKAANGTLSVSGSILQIPTYGTDGRPNDLESDTVASSFAGSDFVCYTGRLSYGVRGLGTSYIYSQQAALAYSRSSVRAYSAASARAAVSVWESNGSAILDIFCRKNILGGDTFTDADIYALTATAEGIRSMLEYMDLSLRQGMIGFAATQIKDQIEFKKLRAGIENTAIPLYMLTDSVSLNLPDPFDLCISQLHKDIASVENALILCSNLKGGHYTWEQISPILDNLLDEDNIYLGEEKLSDLSSSTTLTRYNELKLTSNAGPLASISDFAGDYIAYFDLSDRESMEVRTSSKLSTTHSAQIAQALDTIHAAIGETYIKQVPMKDIFAYAIDMAFRCNTTSDLLLQTAASDRISEDAEVSAQGAGSYMRFSSKELTTKQVVSMMSAIRIGFLDDKQQLLGIGKLNVQDYRQSGTNVYAPIYLHNYTLSEDGKLITQASLGDDQPIASLSAGTAKIITVVVWLDGDHVDNSLASITAKSMNGVLNLQFASTANLISSDQEVKPKN